MNQSTHRRMMQCNEVRLMQNNQIIASRKTTMVEESIVQVSAARSSRPPNQSFRRAFCNNAYSSTLQTTRRMVTVNHATQPHKMKNPTTEEMVYLD